MMDEEKNGLFEASKAFAEANAAQIKFIDRIQSDLFAYKELINAMLITHPEKEKVMTYFLDRMSHFEATFEDDADKENLLAPWRKIILLMENSKDE